MEIYLPLSVANNLRLHPTIKVLNALVTTKYSSTQKASFDLNNSLLLTCITANRRIEIDQCLNNYGEENMLNRLIIYIFFFIEYVKSYFCRG